MRETLWPLTLGRGAALELHFLGQAEAWYEGDVLPLSLVERELVTLLLLHPQGLTLDRLHDLLGERASRNGLKTILSRLRRRLPISSCPYRLETTVHADFTELTELSYLTSFHPLPCTAKPCYLG
jgi:hypothetical protein